MPNDDFKNDARRIFAAIFPPENVQTRLFAFSQHLVNVAGNAKLRRTPPQNLHITLRFIARADDDTLHGLQYKADRIAMNAVGFRLWTTNVGVFRNRGGSALWVGISEEPESDTTPISAKIASELHEEILTKFAPHITLARGRLLKSVAFKHLAVPRLCFEAKEIVIVESILRPHGAEYGVISRHPFKARATLLRPEQPRSPQ